MSKEKFNLDFQTIEEAAQSASNQNRRELLEKNRLSRLPKLPERRSFTVPDIQFPKQQASCVGCGGRLEPDNDLQKSVKGCRKCIGIYARLDTAFDEAEKTKRRDMLERLVGGGNDRS